MLATRAPEKLILSSDSQKKKPSLYYPIALSSSATRFSVNLKYNSPSNRRTLASKKKNETIYVLYHVSREAVGN